MQIRLTVPIGVLVAAVALSACVLSADGTARSGASGGSGGSGGSSGIGGSGAGAAGGAGGAGDTTSSAGGGGATTGGDGGGGGGTTSSGGGSETGCSDGTQADYEILQVGGGAIQVNGTCDEAAWAAAPAIQFTGHKTTSNGVTCKMLWQDGADVVYGCCAVTDTDLGAGITTDDTDNIWNDDGLEIILSDDTIADWTQTTSKVHINVQEACWDTNYLQGDNTPNKAYSANVSRDVALQGSLNNGPNDTGYTLEWKANIGFNATPEQIGLCDLMLDDRDGGSNTYWKAFGQGSGSFNDPERWGTCKFSCVPVGAR